MKTVRQFPTLTIAPPPAALLRAPTPDVEPLRTAEELEAEELRLLAMAVGDHLPPEIQSARAAPAPPARRA